LLVDSGSISLLSTHLFYLISARLPWSPLALVGKLLTRNDLRPSRAQRRGENFFRKNAKVLAQGADIFRRKAETGFFNS